MVILPINFYRKQAGLTLIEVLIALAIVSIAITAIIKATSQSIRATTYLQNKTQALWVGKEVMNEARVGLLKLPSHAEKIKQAREILNHTWYWQAVQEETPNNHIKKIIVNVFSDENEESTPIVSLESYVYHVE